MFANIHFASDIAALAVAWYLTIDLRIRLNPWMPAKVSRSAFTDMIPHPLVIVALWTVVALWLGPYRRKSVLSAVEAFRQAIESDLIACTLAIVVTFFYRGVSNDISRSFIFLFGPVSLVLLGLSFYVSAFVAIRAESRWTKPKRVAVVGDGADAHSNESP